MIGGGGKEIYLDRPKSSQRLKDGQVQRSPGMWELVRARQGVGEDVVGAREELWS